MKKAMLLLGETIKRARIDKGLSQKELADYLKKTPTYISIIERGAQMPSHELLIILGEKLDLPYPLLVLLSTDISEVPVQKQNVFETLKKTAVTIIESMFKTEEAA